MKEDLVDSCLTEINSDPEWDRLYYFLRNGFNMCACGF